MQMEFLSVGVFFGCPLEAEQTDCPFLSVFLVLSEI